MAQWEQIRRTRVEVIGVDSQRSGCLNVRIHLSTQPPSHWWHYFQRPPTDPTPVTMDPPQPGQSWVHVSPTDTELESYVRNVDQRIDAANAEYERVVLPQLARRTHEVETKVDDQQHRLEEAQRRADEL